MVANPAHALPCLAPALSETMANLPCLRRLSHRLVLMIEAEAEVQAAPAEHAAPQTQVEQTYLYRVARGDRSALAQLYTQFAPLMMGLAVRIIRDRKEAEDVIHDVFVEAWKRAGDYDPTRSSVKAWLLMMVRSRALDRVRSARSKQLTLVAALPDVAAVTNDVNIGERSQLHGALARLTQEQRSVLELGYFQGLSSQEIATTLGVPVGTVKSRVAAALGNLRVMLGHSEEGAEQP